MKVKGIDGNFLIQLSFKPYGPVKESFLKFKPDSVDTAYSTKSISCGWKKCEFGLIIVDKNIDKKEININNNLDFKYAVLILLKTQKDYINFETIIFKDNGFLLDGCPYKNYISPLTQIEYIIDEDTFKSGITIPTLSNNHILLPIIPKNDGDTFYKCGILKQPMLPDIKMGFKLDYNHDRKPNVYDAKEYPNIKMKDCRYQENQMGWFHILRKLVNDDFKTKVIPINKANQNLASLKYYYDLSKISINYVTSDEITVKAILPTCIDTEQFDKETVFPSPGGMYRINQVGYRNELYYIIDEYDYDLEYDMVCLQYFPSKQGLSESVKKADSSYFYVNKVNFPSGKEEKVRKMKIKNNDFTIYSKYICKADQQYVNSLYTFRPTYLTPYNNTIINLDPIKSFNKTLSNHFLCKKQISEFDRYDNSTITKKSGKEISLKYKFDSTTVYLESIVPIEKLHCTLRFNVTLTCRYKTLAETYFSISQVIEVNMKDEV
uniref:Ig-like domain-containing protein n=1 Tax=Parastrongyloides trichosuri TaxID=131310 RepID=A0A0N4Z4H4_PARTI